LDDVQNKFQFEKLIPNASFLAPGSAIIVTSRDQHLFNLVARKSCSYLHEVTSLGCEDYQKLFNWHAFGDELAPKNFKAIANDVRKACGGLPLALKIVDSSLFNKISNENLKCIWLEAIEVLKGDTYVMSALQ
jgi:hypothetical protein